MPCIRELFRFNISLINDRDRHNNETMIGMGLSLLTVALETGGAHMSRFPSLREVITAALQPSLVHTPGHTIVLLL